MIVQRVVQWVAVIGAAWVSSTSVFQKTTRGLKASVIGFMWRPARNSPSALLMRKVGGFAIGGFFLPVWRRRYSLHFRRRKSRQGNNNDVTVAGWRYYRQTTEARLCAGRFLTSEDG